jgi:hypothetical protein
MFVAADPQAIPFEDVGERDWFADAVMYAYENGYRTGTSANPILFSPNRTLTRGMVVTALYRMAGSPDVSGFANPFNDVDEEKYYTNAILWAAAGGIVSGTGGGKFSPESNITRQDLVVILNNYANFAGMDLPKAREYTAFADDADIRGYAREAVERFFRAMIISGRPQDPFSSADGGIHLEPGNVFDPHGNATRAEFAAMLMRFMEAAE